MRVYRPTPLYSGHSSLSPRRDAHRTSFTPETTLPKRNEHARPQMKMQQNH
jgi:hypothetical protein